MRHLLLVLVAVLSSVVCAGEPAAVSRPMAVEDFALLDHRGEFHQLSRHSDAAFVVLYVFSNGCPIVRQNVTDLEKLAAEYAPKGVRMCALDPATQDDRAAVVEETKSLAMTLPVLLDDTQLIAEGLGITRTGEAIVVRTKDWTLAWRGPIDDRVGYGAQKPVATRHYLAEALEAVLAGQPVPTDAPPSKGCAITFAKARDQQVVDYAKDVAPILSARCRDCHQKGGIGPWSMDNHKKVSGSAKMMREVIRTHAMPPWGADRAYGSFANDCALSVDEQRTIVHWIEQGAKPGASDPLADKPTKAPPEWPLGKPDLIVALPEQQIPATGTLPYRNLELTVPLPKDTWIRAVDLRPSNRTNLHHAFAFDGEEELPEDIAADPRVARLLDQLKGRPLPPELKERLDKRPRGLTSFFATYVPGLDPAPFPEGSGRLLPKDAKLSFQLHYTTNGTAGTDKPRLGLYFAKGNKPLQEMKVTSAFQLRLDIPPQDRHHQVEATRSFTKDTIIHALSPHMHYRGSAMRFTAEYPDGTSEVLLSVPQYDLDWQHTYRLAKPKTVPAGTKIRCQGVYDNSATNPHNPDATKRVRFGAQSWDEMFIGYIVYTDSLSAGGKEKR